MIRRFVMAMSIVPFRIVIDHLGKVTAYIGNIASPAVETHFDLELVSISRSSTHAYFSGVTVSPLE
jgi:hypothetical protein